MPALPYLNNNRASKTMNRIDQIFKKCRSENRKALIMFVSAGDPSLDFTARLIPRIIESGADIVEIGVPFSDPMADGPTIQMASERAIAAGATLPRILDMICEVRKSCPDTAFVLFSYYNVLLQYGVEKLAAKSAEVGIDGWLVVDVPAEEDDEVVPILERHGLYKIPLIAPTTPHERMKKLLKNASGFVYYVTVTGVTGARAELPDDLSEHLDQVKRLSAAPVAAGFGTPEMARMIGEHADGVIVGSKLIKTIQAAPDESTALANATDLVANLAKALRG
jgi:tryptophan synthase alpha chain